MSTRSRRPRWRRRPGLALLALTTLVVTVTAATGMRPVDLSEVLLIVLVEVIAVALVAGRTVAGVTALVASVAVNWLLVPPYGTLHMERQQDWVALAVFLGVALGANSLVHAVLASESAAARVATHEHVLGQVLNPRGLPVVESLRILCSALDLDEAALVDATTDEVLVSTMGHREPPYPPCLRVDVSPGFRVMAWGPQRRGVRTDYATTLATAAVRAWQGQKGAAEREKGAASARADQARDAGR